MGLWEEEQVRSSPICKANSYDKRIATSEVATGDLAMREVYCVVVLIAKAVSEINKKIRNTQEKGNCRYLKK